MAMPWDNIFNSHCSLALPQSQTDPVMFEALKRLAIQPNECLHIGDDIEHDDGANRSIRTTITPALTSQKTIFLQITPSRTLSNFSI